MYVIIIIIIGEWNIQASVAERREARRRVEMKQLSQSSPNGRNAHPSINQPAAVTWTQEVPTVQYAPDQV